LSGVHTHQEVHVTSSIEHFIITWQHANSLEEVVEKTGLSGVRSASSKASALRRQGIPLKRFVTGVKSNKAHLVEVARAALADARSAAVGEPKKAAKKDEDLPEEL
jgi:hypothetical protein